MKLARTHTHAVCQSGRGILSILFSRRLSARTANAIALDILQPRSALTRRAPRLTMRWHVSADTGRLECGWSEDAGKIGDPPLCRGRKRASRGSRPLSHHRNRHR